MERGYSHPVDFSGESKSNKRHSDNDRSNILRYLSREQHEITDIISNCVLAFICAKCMCVGCIH